MKRALLLAGGGAHGAYQVGILRKLVLEQGLDFDIIRGVSVGALNGAFLAEAPTGAGSIDNLKAQVQKLTELWREEIRGNDSIYTKRFGGFAAFAVGAAEEAHQQAYLGERAASLGPQLRGWNRVLGDGQVRTF